MNIRKAEQKDISGMKRLLVQLGYAGLDESCLAEKIHRYTSGNYELLVAEVTGQVSGFISLHWFEMLHSPEKAGRITAFCVDESFRGQGVGTNC